MSRCITLLYYSSGLVHYFAVLQLGFGAVFCCITVVYFEQLRLSLGDPTITIAVLLLFGVRGDKASINSNKFMENKLIDT